MTSTSNLHYTNQFSQVYNPAELAYQDCVIKSGIDPEIFRLNFECASDRAVYDLLYRDTDPTTNSGGSAQAKRNYTKCENVIGWIANGRFRQLSGPPIAFDKKGRPRTYFQPQGKSLFGELWRLKLGYQCPRCQPSDSREKHSDFGIG
jgi:hypothetical protein